MSHIFRTATRRCWNAICREADGALTIWLITHEGPVHPSFSDTDIRWIQLHTNETTAHLQSDESGRS